ncbi:glycosyltransferase family 9 protein [Fusobacterium sp. PH5-44]|uniref:glycosyltransferase family 9 protein n=1 Tax=unclassified Fusobacterium TaxID=2648384 RepID=UPI003D1966D6
MKILIIHTAFIGDIILSTPLISKLRDKYPESNITYLTIPSGKSILNNNLKLNRIISYDKKGKDKGFINLWKLIKKLRKEKYDLVLSLHRYLRSSLIAYGTGAPIIIGYNVAPASFLFSKKIAYDQSKHEVERLLSFINSKEEKRYEIELYPSMENRERAEKLIGNIHCRKLIIIAPGSRWATKRWPVAYFNELLEKLSKEKNMQLAVVGGKEELDLNLIIPENVLDFRGKTSLLDLVAMIEKSTLLLSNDSSPLHIASAFENVRIFGIFGPTGKKLGFFPWSKNNEVYEVDDLKCRPCSLHGSKKCPKGHFKCMMGVHPEAVINGIKRYIDEKSK